MQKSKFVLPRWMEERRRSLWCLMKRIKAGLGICWESRLPVHIARVFRSFY